MGETRPGELINADNARDIALDGLGLGLEGLNLRF